MGARKRTMPAAAKPAGPVISKATPEEIKAGREWKKNPKISFQVHRLQRDGKNIIKVRRIEDYGGIKDSRLVFQSVNGKPVMQGMRAEALRAAGVDLNF